MIFREVLDVLIVGGGINGAGIARDAAGRGLKVCLVEQEDLAQHTSSASTKLIHGGLRYLEYWRLHLVREALRERERLLMIAPHLITPMRFVVPEGMNSRPNWMIATGLFVYDHLGGRSVMKKSRSIRLTGSELGVPLRPGIARGFAYSDCAVDDSRLVVANAIDAAARGADIRVQTRLLRARRQDSVWHAEIEDLKTGTQHNVAARVLVNAAGPWVGEVLSDRLKVPTAQSLRLVKGSHIVVPRLYDGGQAYLFQNPDGRVVFSIPYQTHLTLIGTTDVPWEGSPSRVEISPAETVYLCESVNRYFRHAITPPDVVWSFAGLRPLYNDGAGKVSDVTRDYVLSIDAPKGEAPLLSVFGGKITTYRHLAERAFEELSPYFGALPAPWTANTPLPGGDITKGDMDQFTKTVRERWPFLEPEQSSRMAHAYGTRISRILCQATKLEDLGTAFGHGLTQAEVDYLVREEWAVTVPDILFRRTKLGLRLDGAETKRLEEYLTAKAGQIGHK